MQGHKTKTLFKKRETTLQDMRKETPPKVPPLLLTPFSFLRCHSNITQFYISAWYMLLPLYNTDAMHRVI